MFHVKHSTSANIYLPKNISNTLMSAGETPLILEACAMVLGFILLSFCLASAERLLIFVKSKSSGILMFSNLCNLATFSFSFLCNLCILY